MRRPRQHRSNSRAKAVKPPPDGTDLEAVAEQVRYQSSPYHSRAARIQKNRPDASKCPSEVSNDLARVELWLRQAISAGATGGVWEGGFPRYVWHRVDNVVFEARQGSPGTGVYHGYPLSPQEDVRGLA